MKVRVMMIMTIAAALTVSGAAFAQSGNRLVTSGITAYRSLEYDSAVVLFRRALAESRDDSGTRNARIEILAYLGASEQLRGQSDSAASAFVNAIALDPRYRIDELVFPPAVTGAFEEARLRTAYIDVSAPADTIIVAGSQAVPLHLFVSAPNEVTVTLVRQNGEVVRQIYSGAITDSLNLRWDGMDATGNDPIDGNMLLQVKGLRAVTHGGASSLSLSVMKFRVDTLMHPAQPRFAAAPPRRSQQAPAFRALAVGTIAGATAIFLPEIIGKDGSAMPERYVLGATLGAAGILGFLSAKQGARLEQQAAANAKRLDEWRRAVDSVRQENSRRLRSPRLRITSGSYDFRTGAGA